MRNARYLLRIDDVCPTIDWAIWHALEEMLLAYRVRPIVAVVPDNRDERLVKGPPIGDFWARVRAWESRGWTIGIHGYQHRYETRNGGLIGLNAYSEFAGLSLSVQRRKLSRAMEVFRRERIDARVWVAPAHSFDRNTILVLQELGITTVSDGFYGRVVRRYGVNWIPQQLWRFRAMPCGLWTVCIHPDSLTARALEKLDFDLRRFASRIVAFDDVLKSEVPAPVCTTFDMAFQHMWSAVVRAKRLVRRLRSARRYGGIGMTREREG